MGVIDSLKNCFFQKPPAVVFLACFTIIGLSFTALSFYVSRTNLRDPDIEIDWNVILGNMAKVDYCATEVHEQLTSQSSLRSKANRSSTAQPVTTASSSNRNFSVAMLMTLTRVAQAPLRNLSQVQGSLYGKQLGLRGSLEEEQVNVTFQLPLAACGAVSCSPVLTCVRLQAAEGVFPVAKQPAECQPLNESLPGLHSQLRGSLRSLVARLGCSGTQIKLQYATDAELTVMMSLNDRSVASLHLLHTSYFVFVMAVFIFFFSVLRSQRSQYSSAHELKA